MVNTGTRVSYKEAINVAAEALKEMIPDAEQPRLEQVVLSDDDKKWMVMFSFLTKDPSKYDALAELLKVERSKIRQARVFEIDANTGHFRGMSASVSY